MRIFQLLLLGITASLIAASSKVVSTEKSIAKHTEATTVKPKSLKEPTNSPKESTKSSGATTTRSSKSLKAPGDNRGKRTLYDFGNAGYLYSNVASRRAGYSAADTHNYYPQNGFFNGQSAFAQYPQDYNSHFGHYPQYLEAPEPIIEIIIKDSNETLPTPAPEPIITKKKKEKVHVFYVNYKKDHNNKLHLESPIASLNNDDVTEEEEEILHIPVPVTQSPPLKTTTLRTIIHPDSEKYHSNSGIHVTFGTEDKSQAGHILEEHDAESIQSHVVALPVGSNPSALNGLKSDAFLQQEEPRSPAFNQLFDGPFQRAHYYQTEQQLPAQNHAHYFRPQRLLIQAQAQPPPSPPQQQQTQSSSAGPSYYQKLPNIQPPKFLTSQAPLLPQPQALYHKAPTTQQQIQQQQHQQQQHQQAHYYANFNQHFQQQTPFYQPLSHKQGAPSKSSFVFPTAPPKLQELPSRQPPTPYQPIKFRPTPVPVPLPQIKPVPIPAKLDNTNYQTQQTTQQYKTQTQFQKPQQTYQQQQQQQASKNPTQPSTPYYFNRQPQFVRNPSFTVPSPTIPAYFKAPSQATNSQSNSQYVQQKVTQASSNVNNYQTLTQNQQHNTAVQVQQQSQSNNAQQTVNQGQKQQQQQQLQLQQQFQQPLSSGSASNTANNNAQQSITHLSALHNYFDIQPSKETELLKSIPKFEQHITETIHHPTGTHYQTQAQANFNDFNFSNRDRNQVIHDIPAPNLAPTTQPSHSHSQSEYLRGTVAPITGHYITASNLNSQVAQQQYSKLVTASLPATTVAPQFAESTDGQKIMIVTPMPPIIYNQYHSSQYNNQDTTNNQQQYSTQSQIANNYAQQPRQAQSTVQSLSNIKTGNTQYSVSTYHSDVFRELDQRKQQQQQHQQEHNQQKQQIQQQQQQQKENQQRTQQNQEEQALIDTKQGNNFNQHQNSYTPQTKPVHTAPSSAQNSQAEAQNNKSPQSLFQLPDEVPDDLRQQLLSSGILNNADISVLDYDKVGAVNLENLPAEHLQHFYGNGGGAQISESNKVLTVVKPNGEQVSLSEKELERVKTTNSVPKKHNLDVKVVRFDTNNHKSVTDKYLKADATVVPPVDIADRQYNRYLPLKINGAQFPIPDVEELQGKKIVSVVVLAPVDGDSSSEGRSSHSDATTTETKEVKFLNGDLIKTLVKKPSKENFKRWLEKEAKTDVEQQSVVLLVTSASKATEQEIFMYDVSTHVVNKLNGELSSKFVSVAEENASTEDFEHASTLDPSALEQMMKPSTSHS